MPRANNRVVVCLSPACPALPALVCVFVCWWSVVRTLRLAFIVADEPQFFAFGLLFPNPTVTWVQCAKLWQAL